MRISAGRAAAVLALLVAGSGCARSTRQDDGGVPARFQDLPARPTRELFEFPADPQAPEGAQESEAGPPAVARLEVVVPDRERFVVHGTLPVPRGLALDAPGRTPLALLVPGTAQPVPAQVEVVSRYPTGEPDVVELAAPVARGALEPGRRLRLAVVQGDWPRAGGPDVPEASAALADPARPGPLQLRTRDVFGHLYRVDLTGDPESPGFGAAALLAEGTAYRRRRTYSTLVPVQRAAGERGRPLPHLMGVHAYLTEWAGDGRLSLELRVHNGCTAGSGEPTSLDRPLGIVYWDALELVVPAGWSVEPLVRDPAFGRAYREGRTTVVPLVAPRADGRLHMMGPQAQLHRRLTLVPADAPARRHHEPALEGLAFCQPEGALWSWWNPATARYFPQRSLLAHWGPYRRGSLTGDRALRARLDAWRGQLAATLESGRAQGGLIAGPRMGWAQPLGASTQGMTGGWGIAQLEGHRAAAAASAQGVEALMLEHRMNAARQPEAQWTRTGEPAGVFVWRRPDGRVPFDFRTHGRVVPPEFALPCQGGPAPSAQLAEVHLRGLRPPYDQGTPQRPDGALPGRDDALLAWMPHDGAHLVRYTKNTKALVWLANDALARDDLLLSAELFHLYYHEFGHVPASWSVGATLRVHEGLASAYPHHGLPMGRDQAWGIDAMCAAYSVAPPAWRERHRPWFTRVARLMLAGAMPSGLLERITTPKILGGRYAAAQAFECLFLLHAQRCLAESVLAGTDDALRAALDDLHRRALEYLFWGPVWACLPDAHARHGTVCGPRWHFAVAAPDDWAAPPFSDAARWGEGHLPPDPFDGGVEASYVWGPLEYGLLTSPAAGTGLANRYLRRALQCWTHPGDAQAMVRALFEAAARDSGDNSANWAGFVGRLQSLGVEGRGP